MLDKIQKQMIKQYPQLQQKSSIFQNYMSLQYPQKQRKLISWWEEMIMAAVKKSGQIYLSPADLQIIFTLHGLKPVPLQKVLEYLCKNQKLQWSGRQQQHKTKQSAGKGWLSGISSYFWKQGPSKQNDVTKSGFKSLQLRQNQKIIPKAYKQQLQQTIKKIIKKQVTQQNSISYNYIYDRIRQQIFISNQSIEMLLQDLQSKNQIRIQQVQNKKIIIYTNDLKAMKDPNWVQIQKSKFAIKSTLQLFDKKINLRLNQQTKKLQQAKSFLETQQSRSKRLLGQVHIMRKTTNQLENRRRLLRQTLDELEMNQLNMTTIDVVGKCQKIIQSTMADVSQIQSLKDKHLQISYQNKQINQHLQEMTNGEIKDQVDNILAELQEQIAKEKKSKTLQRQRQILRQRQREKKQQANLN